MSSRRRFLQGLGGMALGLPWLEFLPRQAQAADGAPPKRVLFVVTGHSTQQSYANDYFTPVGNASGISSMSSYLQPLAPYQDRMTVVRGLGNWLFSSLNSNPHHGAGKTLLNCMPPQHAINASGQINPGHSVLNSGSIGGGPSIDHVLAQALGGQSLSLRVGLRHGEHRPRWFELGGQMFVDFGHASPLDGFDAMLGLMPSVVPDDPPGEDPPPPTELTPREKLRRHRSTVLDSVHFEYQRLLSKVGHEDKVRLERHAALVNALEEKLRLLDQGQTGGGGTGGGGTGGGEIYTCSPQPSNLILPSGWPAGTINYEDGNGRLDDLIFDAHAQLVTTAFACNAHQVASIHFSNIQANKFPWLSGDGSDFISDGWHAMVHHDQGTEADRTAIMRWYSQAVANLLDKLSAVPEGEGTLLDNTLVVWVSNFSSSSHNQDDLPVVLLGNLQNTIQSGRVLDYDSNRSIADLYVSILNAMDIPATTFGWNVGSGSRTFGSGVREFNNGPLAELFI